MALYDNLSKKSPLTAVEFSPVPEGNFSFFYVDSPVKKDLVKGWLTSEAVGQNIVAETMIDGRPVLVTKGDKTQEEMMKLLEGQGDQLSLHKDQKGINFWAMRGAMSMVGQSLQMVSAVSRVVPDEKAPGTFKRKIEKSFFMFAGLNMLANITNFIFGSQKTPDDNQLAYLKEQFNNKLDSHVAPGQALPDVDDERAKLRREPPKPKTTGQKIYDFCEKRSVTWGEVGLRFAASVGLIFPVFKQGAKDKLAVGWGEMAKLASKGELSQAVKAGVTKNNLAFWAGALYVAGKSMSLLSKTPDPYDDSKPHTAIDTYLEKYNFKLATLTELAAAGMVVANGATNTVSFDKSLKPSKDWAGMIGGALFAGGFLMRLGAPFGEKKMDMEELHAHISDSLAKTPPEKLPQLIAESAATLKEHFKDKPLEFGKLYVQMANDLYKYHHIPLDFKSMPENKSAESQTQVAQAPKPAVTQPMAAAASETVAETRHAHKEEEPKHAHKHTQRKSASDLAAIVPASSHVEKAAQASEVQHSLGA